jgi:hypothetical protein
MFVRNDFRLGKYLPVTRRTASTFSCKVSFCLISTKKKASLKFLSIKFHENPFRGSRVVWGVQTDEQMDERKEQIQ